MTKAMTSTVGGQKPIALIIEDDAAKLRTRRLLFSTEGFQPIEARTAEEAVRQFRSTPTVDIVVADINLRSAEPMDKSGVKVVTDIRRQRPDLPIIGLSGCLKTLKKSEKKPFTHLRLKGSSVAMEDELGGWKRAALEYRQARADSARRELASMRRERNLPAPDVELVRGFLPGTHLPEEEFATPDEILRREGWRLRLVAAEWRSAEEGEHRLEGSRAGGVVPFWIRREGEATIALLHGHPCIYSDGDSEADAVEGALTLMYGYHRQFCDDSGRALGAEMAALRDYLGTVFQ